MNNALTSLLSGRPGDPTNLQDYFNAGMGSNGSANFGQSNAQFNPSRVGGGYSPQMIDPRVLQSIMSSFQPAQVQGGFAQQNVNTGVTPQNVFSQYTPGQVNTQYNPLQISGAYNAPSYVTPNSPNVLNGIGTQAQLQNIVNPQGAIDATKALFSQQSAQDIANLRERFGNQALGSGAQYAESQYRAQAAPQQALALDQITRANNQQLLDQNAQTLQNQTANRGLDINQLGLGSTQSLALANAANQFNQGNSQFGAGLNQQAQLANQAAGFQAAGFGQQGQSLNNQFGLSANDQVLRALFGNQAAALQAAGMNQQGQIANNQFAQANAGQNLQAQLANQQALLSAAGLNQQGQITNNAQLLQALFGNQNAGLQGAQLNQAGNIANNQFGLNAAQMNQGNQQFNINSALQNQQLMNQFAQAMQGIGVQRQGIQSGAQQNMIAQIMAALGGTQRLGTAQADTTVAPSTFSQIAQGAGAIGNIYNAVNQAQNAAPQVPQGIDWASLLGGMPGIQQTPGMQIPNGIIPNVQMPIFANPMMQ